MSVSADLWKAVEAVVLAGRNVGPKPNSADVDELRTATAALRTALQRDHSDEGSRVLDAFVSAGAGTPMPDHQRLVEAVSLGKAFLGAHRQP
jgi:hypothetical protein